jgi:hypothetical protein
MAKLKVVTIHSANVFSTAEVPDNKTWADVEDYKVGEWGTLSVKFKGVDDWIELEGDTDQEDINPDPEYASIYDEDDKLLAENEVEEEDEDGDEA